MGDVVWRYDLEQKKFFEESNIGFNSGMMFLYLDDDKYPDLFVLTRGDGSGVKKILLGSENGFTEIFNSKDYSCTGGTMTVQGNGGNMRFTCRKGDFFDYENSITYFYRLNCNKKKFELYEQYKGSEISISDGIITSIDLKKISIVIRDKKDLTDTSYKFHKVYKSKEGLKYLQNNFKAGDSVSFYTTIKDKQTILFIGSHE